MIELKRFLKSHCFVTKQGDSKQVVSESPVKLTNKWECFDIVKLGTSGFLKVSHHCDHIRVFFFYFILLHNNIEFRLLRLRK